MISNSKNNSTQYKTEIVSYSIGNSKLNYQYLNKFEKNGIACIEKKELATLINFSISNTKHRGIKRPVNVRDQQKKYPTKSSVSVKASLEKKNTVWKIGNNT